MSTYKQYLVDTIHNHVADFDRDLLEHSSIHQLVELAKSYNLSVWVPVIEQLPSPYTTMLLSADELYELGYFDNENNIFRKHRDSDITWNKEAVTHWMPLPDLPN